jgi:hypothetical protein
LWAIFSGITWTIQNSAMAKAGTTARTNQAMPSATASRVSPENIDARAGDAASSERTSSAVRNAGAADARYEMSGRKMNLRAVSENGERRRKTPGNDTREKSSPPGTGVDNSP